MTDQPRMTTDELGDQMKFFEKQTHIKMMPMLPTLARIDGRAFHTFTRGMKRPFDPRFSLCMLMTASRLAEETNARLCYTQSDEITLCWLADSFSTQIWFDNKHSKMVSNLASLATLYFNQAVAMVMPEFLSRNPTFDARVWQVPNKEEACKVFYWREKDAVRNSVAAATSAIIGHSRMMNKNSTQMKEMLFEEARIDWNDYPASFKRGQYIQRVKVLRPYTVEEIDKLPEKHNARTNPDLVVERSTFRPVQAPPFKSIINQEGFVFRGESPMTHNEHSTCKRPISGSTCEGDGMVSKKEESTAEAVPAVG